MISTKGRYALRVMIDLAENDNGSPIPLKDIAERQDISKKYLEIIVKDLVHGNLVSGVSGKGGGYRLSKKPEEMYAIIERLYKNRSYVELFARKRPTNKGWRIWGLEAEGGSDIFIPGYPVPEYSQKVRLAKKNDLEGDEPQ